MIFFWATESNFKIGTLFVFWLFVVDTPKTLVVVKVGYCTRATGAGFYLCFNSKWAQTDNIGSKTFSVLPITRIDWIVTIKPDCPFVSCNQFINFRKICCPLPGSSHFFSCFFGQQYLTSKSAHSPSDCSSLLHQNPYSRST